MARVWSRFREFVGRYSVASVDHSQQGFSLGGEYDGLKYLFVRGLERGRRIARNFSRPGIRVKVRVEFYAMFPEK